MRDPRTLGVVCVAMLLATHAALASDATVTVDFAVSEPDGTNMVGFANGAFPDEEGTAHLVLDLEPALYRAGPTLLHDWDRVAGFGVDTRMLNVGTEVDWLLEPEWDLWNDRDRPYLYPDEYEQYLRNLADDVVGRGISHEIVYSFWNEGNRWAMFKGSHEEFLDTFVIFNETLRDELGDGIKIAAPSYGYFGTGIRDDEDDLRLTSFFDNALEHGLQVNYLGLHLFARIGVDFEDLPDRLTRYWEKFGPNSVYAPVGLEAFIIDETGNDDDHLRPASVYAWLDLMDELGVFRMARTGIKDRDTVCVLEGIPPLECIDIFGDEIQSDNAWNQSLNGALTHNEFQTEIEIAARPVWWAYRYHVLGLTDRVQTESDDPTLYVSSSTRSETAERTQTVIAFVENSEVVENRPEDAVKDVTVTFENAWAIPWLTTSRVRVDIQRIPYDGLGIYPLKEPEMLTQGMVVELTPEGDAEVELAKVAAHEIYVVQLYPVASPTDEPALSLYPQAIDFEVYEGLPELTHEFTVSNAGGGSTNWNAAALSGDPRFTFEPASGSLGWAEQAQVLLRIDLLGMPDGTYADELLFQAPQANNGPITAPLEGVILDNAAPIAYDATALTEEEFPIGVELEFEDDDQPGAYSIEITRFPSNGSLVEHEVGKYLYTPDAGFAGEDGFLWVANDGAANSNEASAIVTVEGIPEISIDAAGFQWVVYRGNPEVSDSFVLTNVGLGELEWTAETLPLDMNFVFTPPGGTLAPGASETVSLSNDTANAPAGEYFASLGILDADARNHPFEVPLALNVLENAEPIATSQTVLTSEGTPITIELDATDDGVPGPYAFSLVSPPASGSLLEQASGVYQYTPDPGFSGPDSFRWNVSDGLFVSDTATVQVGRERRADRRGPDGRDRARRAGVDHPELLGRRPPRPAHGGDHVGAGQRSALRAGPRPVRLSTGPRVRRQRSLSVRGRRRAGALERGGRHDPGHTLKRRTTISESRDRDTPKIDSTSRRQATPTAREVSSSPCFDGTPVALDPNDYRRRLRATMREGTDDGNR